MVDVEGAEVAHGFLGLGFGLWSLVFGLCGLDFGGLVFGLLSFVFGVWGLVFGGSKNN